MSALEVVANRQAAWSVTANALKKTVDHARWGVFILSSLGAILAAVASQMPASLAGSRSGVAIAAAICLAFATFFTQRRLGADRVGGWVRARAASERLKREAFKYAMKAAPYDDAATADGLLSAELQKVESDVNDLLKEQVSTTEKGSSPRNDLDLAGYMAGRVEKQLRFYREKADKYQRTASRLRAIELALAGGATLLTAVASVIAKPAIFGMPFDLAALTAVLTTLGGAVLAHVEAERFDFLVVTYRATALQLERRMAAASTSLSDFVNDCENILSAENASWIAKWSK